MAHFNPVEELLKARPELANGPHMNHIAQDLIKLSLKNPKSARRIAAAIMRSSPTRSTAMDTTAIHLLKVHDAVTETEFQGVSQEYSQPCGARARPRLVGHGHGWGNSKILARDTWGSPIQEFLLRTLELAGCLDCLPLPCCRERRVVWLASR